MFDPLDCDEFVELATEYLEHTIERDDAERIDAHLGICNGCDEYLRQMRLTQRVIEPAVAQALPPVVRESLLNVFRTWKRET